MRTTTARSFVLSLKGGSSARAAIHRQSRNPRSTTFVHRGGSLFGLKFGGICGAIALTSASVCAFSGKAVAFAGSERGMAGIERGRVRYLPRMRQAVPGIDLAYAVLGPDRPCGAIRLNAGRWSRRQSSRCVDGGGEADLSRKREGEGKEEGMRQVGRESDDFRVSGTDTAAGDRLYAKKGKGNERRRERRA
eukprot:2285976-Rhodomonas_salina.1